MGDILIDAYEKGVFPCPFCSEAEKVVEFYNNYQEPENMILREYIEEQGPNLSKVFKQGEHMHVPIILFKGVVIKGASTVHHLMGTIEGILKAKREL